MDMTEHKEIPLRIIPFLSNYALAVLWFTAEFHNNNLLIRNVNPYVIELLSKYVDVVPENSKTFQDKESSLYVIHHDELVYFLKTVKFFNVGDKRRVAPPVEPFIFVKAFTETRCIFNWRRCYNKGSQSNPIHDSFTPYVSYKDNYDVVEAYKNALITSECCCPSLTFSMQRRGCLEKWSQYSRSYLNDIYRIFSKPIDGETNTVFWDCFQNHVTHEPISYQEYCQKRGNKTIKRDGEPHAFTTVNLYAYRYEENCDNYDPAHQYVYMGEYRPPKDTANVLKGVAITASIPAAFSVREGPDGVALVTPNIDMFVGGYNVRDFAVAIQIRYKPGLTLKIWNRSVAGMRIIDKQFYDVER